MLPSLGCGRRAGAHAEPAGPFTDKFDYRTRTMMIWPLLMAHPTVSHVTEDTSVKSFEVA